MVIKILIVLDLTKKYGTKAITNNI